LLGCRPARPAALRDTGRPGDAFDAGGQEEGALDARVCRTRNGEYTENWCSTLSGVKVKGAFSSKRRRWRAPVFLETHEVAFSRGRSPGPREGDPLFTNRREGVFSETQLPLLRSSRKLLYRVTGFSYGSLRPRGCPLRGAEEPRSGGKICLALCVGECRRESQGFQKARPYVGGSPCRRGRSLRRREIPMVVLLLRREAAL
jgi:hypothetical protein